MADEAILRIGELSRRVGVGVEALRAWERRYGLLRAGTHGGRASGSTATATCDGCKLMLDHLAAGPLRRRGGSGGHARVAGRARRRSRR